MQQHTMYAQSASKNHLQFGPLTATITSDWTKVKRLKKFSGVRVHSMEAIPDIVEYPHTTLFFISFSFHGALAPFKHCVVGVVSCRLQAGLVVCVACAAIGQTKIGTID